MADTMEDYKKETNSFDSRLPLAVGEKQKRIPKRLFFSKKTPFVNI